MKMGAGHDLNRSETGRHGNRADVCSLTSHHHSLCPRPTVLHLLFGGGHGFHLFSNCRYFLIVFTNKAPYRSMEWKEVRILMQYVEF
jgi:hypothetical protein